MAPPPDDLAVDLAGLRLRAPVILASGTAGYGDELADVLDLARVGAVVTKSLTAQPREGHPTWRVLDSRAGMLNAVGLANVGIDHFLEHVSPRLRSAPTTIIASVAGFSIDEYVRVAAALGELDHVPAVELNVSCPNVRGGVEFGADPRALRDLVAAVRPTLPTSRLIVKLSPIAVGHPSIVEAARAAIEGAGREGGPVRRPGADALTISNTVPAMEIDVRTRRPRLSNVTGGLSGPAIHPIAVRLVHEVYRGVARDAGVPIIGCGGVMGWRDAAQLVLAGASAVGMGTALFVDPRAPLRVMRGLSRWTRAQGRPLRDLVGAVEA